MNRERQKEEEEKKRGKKKKKKNWGFEVSYSIFSIGVIILKG
ncbi:unnamed protein product [Musa banksii]